jgi:hypothetical protein
LLGRQQQSQSSPLKLVDRRRPRQRFDEPDRIVGGTPPRRLLIQAEVRCGWQIEQIAKQRGLAGLARTPEQHDPKSAHQLVEPRRGTTGDQHRTNVSLVGRTRAFWCTERATTS